MFRNSNCRTGALLLTLLASVPLSACNDEPATATASRPASQAVTDACALLTAT